MEAVGRWTRYHMSSSKYVLRQRITEMNASETAVKTILPRIFGEGDTVYYFVLSTFVRNC